MCWIKRRKRGRKKVKYRDKKTTDKIERHTKINTGTERERERDTEIKIQGQREIERDTKRERERRRKRKEEGLRGERKETLCITFPPPPPTKYPPLTKTKHSLLWVRKRESLSVQAKLLQIEATCKTSIAMKAWGVGENSPVQPLSLFCYPLPPMRP